MSDALITPTPSAPSSRSWLVPTTPPPGMGSGVGTPVGVTTIPKEPPQVLPVARRRNKKSRPAEDRQPTPESLRVSAWEDDLLVDTVPTIGFYTERYYGPIVGPTCLLIMRSLAGQLSTDTEGFTVVANDLAASIGCSSRAGAASQFWKALRRGVRFGLMRQVDDRLFVRTELSPLTTRLVQRLPVHLRQEHRLWNPIVDLAPQEMFPGGLPQHAMQPLEVLRQAAVGLCTPEELLSLDRARLLR